MGLSGLQRFLSPEGQLATWPSKETDRRDAIAFLAEKFVSGRTYSEREVNDLLKALHLFGDHCLLRRELCDRGFLVRTKAGSSYEVSEAGISSA